LLARRWLHARLLLRERSWLLLLLLLPLLLRRRRLLLLLLLLLPLLLLRWLRLLHTTTRRLRRWTGHRLLRTRAHPWLLHTLLHRLSWLSWLARLARLLPLLPWLPLRRPLTRWPTHRRLPVRGNAVPCPRLLLLLLLLLRWWLHLPLLSVRRPVPLSTGILTLRRPLPTNLLLHLLLLQLHLPLW
jgi:hypothetical protein